MNNPDWKTVLPSPPDGGRLHEAWLTSFEPPDAGLLVEHLLPSLLGTSRSLTQDSAERMLFFGELGTALEALHGRLTVIASPPRAAREDPQYPWLWRYVSNFMVGAQTRAVQHAKLWAFHWKGKDSDFLELHVSSTNLTMSAFKGQLQAGWRVLMPLAQRGSSGKRRTWGDLIPFLNALGASAGDVATSRIQRLIALLECIECPKGVTFVASIPGAKSAARRLTQFKPSAIHVLTPTIGEWSESTLLAWSNEVGITPGKVHLKWISAKHPWAAAGWALSRTAWNAMVAAKVKLQCLPIDARFTCEHRNGDERWSHAKLYLLCSGRRRLLLVTSANWSIAAWGAGKAQPCNFELGVVVDCKWDALEKLGKPFSTSDMPHYVDPSNDDQSASVLQWAEASWDGKVIQLKARSSDSSKPILASVMFADSSPVAASLAEGAATLQWTDPQQTPLTARFMQGLEVLEIDIVDLRPPAEFAMTSLPEVDADLAATLRDAFLLQRYGGPAVDAIPGTASARVLAGVGAPTANYAVQAWLDARAGFEVVDNWRAALGEAKSDPALVERVFLDGKELHALYARRQGAAPQLVVEELGWRMEQA